MLCCLATSQRFLDPCTCETNLRENRAKTIAIHRCVSHLLWAFQMGCDTDRMRARREGAHPAILRLLEEVQWGKELHAPTTPPGASSPGGRCCQHLSAPNVSSSFLNAVEAHGKTYLRHGHPVIPGWVGLTERGCRLTPFYFSFSTTKPFQCWTCKPGENLLLFHHLRDKSWHLCIHQIPHLSPRIEAWM